MPFYVGDAPGVMKLYAGATAPTGYLICDGSAVSRTTYTDLFAAIGTAYGIGNGSSTFNLPDYRGRVPVGQGTHTDVDTLGDNEGAAVGSRRTKHKHTITDPGHVHGGLPGNPNTDTGTGGFYGWTFASYNLSQTSASATTGISVGPQTGSEPTDSAAFLVSQVIIKV